MRYWLNEKTEQKADSYASHSIDLADWWKRRSQRLQFIGLGFGNAFSILWRGRIISDNTGESCKIRIWTDKESLYDRW